MRICSKFAFLLVAGAVADSKSHAHAGLQMASHNASIYTPIVMPGRATSFLAQRGGMDKPDCPVDAYDEIDCPSTCCFYENAGDSDGCRPCTDLSMLSGRREAFFELVTVLLPAIVVGACLVYPAYAAMLLEQKTEADLLALMQESFGLAGQVANTFFPFPKWLKTCAKAAQALLNFDPKNPSKTHADLSELHRQEPKEKGWEGFKDFVDGLDHLLRKWEKSQGTLADRVSDVLQEALIVIGGTAFPPAATLTKMAKTAGNIAGAITNLRGNGVSFNKSLVNMMVKVAREHWREIFSG